MGYTTEFSGHIAIVPPLNEEERQYLVKFNDTRRMKRKNGPYFVDGPEMALQGDDPDIINYNKPPEGQPNMWCGWQPSADGKFIEWDGAEKFYDATEWMQYIIDHFMQNGAELPFMQGNHVLNGVIEAQGEDSDDKWRLVVRDNIARRLSTSEVFYSENFCTHNDFSVGDLVAVRFHDRDTKFQLNFGIVMKAEENEVELIFVVATEAQRFISINASEMRYIREVSVLRENYLKENFTQDQINTLYRLKA